MNLVKGHAAVPSGIGLVLLEVDVELGALGLECADKMGGDFAGVLIANVLAADAGVVTGPAAHIDRVRGAVALAGLVNVRVESEGFVEL